MTISPFDRR